MGIANDLKRKALEVQTELKNKEEQDRKEQIRIQEALTAERKKKFKKSVKDSIPTILNRMELAANAGKTSIEFIPSTLFNCSDYQSFSDILAELRKYLNDPDLKFKPRVEETEGSWADVGDYREGYTTRYLEISW